MIRLKLTDQDLAEVAEALDDPATTERNKINLHANTITNHLKEYSKGGLAGTLEDRFYRPSSSLEPFVECLKAPSGPPR